MELVHVPLEDGELLVIVSLVKDIQINVVEMEFVNVMDLAFAIQVGLEMFAIVQTHAKTDVLDTELVFADNANVILDINF